MYESNNALNIAAYSPSMLTPEQPPRNRRISSTYEVTIDDSPKVRKIGLAFAPSQFNMQLPDTSTEPQKRPPLLPLASKQFAVMRNAKRRICVITKTDERMAQLTATDNRFASVVNENDVNLSVSMRKTVKPPASSVKLPEIEDRSAKKRLNAFFNRSTMKQT